MCSRLNEAHEPSPTRVYVERIAAELAQNPVATAEIREQFMTRLSGRAESRNPMFAQIPA